MAHSTDKPFVNSTIDVLMCVGPADIDYLFLHSLASCIRNFAPLGRLVIVTPDRQRLMERLNGAGELRAEIKVLEDDQAICPNILTLPGWCRQQAIKLEADKLCDSQYIGCLGADTLFLKRVDYTHFFVNGRPILYYNRYPDTHHHLQFERRRVSNVAALLDVEPIQSLYFGDFIMDFMIFDRDILQALRSHLQSRYGENALESILPARCCTMNEKVLFGEWSLYAVFVLDVLGSYPPIRNSESRHLAQVHSEKDLRRFEFNSRIVHFVDKNFDQQYILRKLIEHGVDGLHS